MDILWNKKKMIKTIKYGLKKVLPSSLYLNLLIWKRGHAEHELCLLPYLCDKSKISIDIGAADGLYTTPMLKHSKSCYAFEPQLDASLHLSKLLSGLKSTLYIETVALSPKIGFTNLKLFCDDLGRSTIENENHIESFGDIKIISVPMKRLDDYKFDEKVGCIKIDVEGHEESVLIGAKQILTRDHPSLIIEIEEKHKPDSLKNINYFLKELGYNGFFFYNNHLEPIEKFNTSIHQNNGSINKGGIYINNFLFITNNILDDLQNFI